MQSARINRALNLVMTVETDAGEIYAHSTPVSKTIFRKFFLVMARAHTMIFQVGGGVASGPKIAAMTLEEAAKQMSVWEGPEGVEKGLFPEIRRLTNVIVPSPRGGWQHLPLQDAQAQGSITEDDAADIESAATFFTLASAMQHREGLIATTSGMQLLWGAQITSLNCTDFAAGLPISTETASSGEMGLTSSVAY